jgi:hypothetical protein
MPHGAHNDRKIASALQHPGSVIVATTIQDQFFGKPGAANAYFRAEGLRYAPLMRMSLLARNTDLRADELVLLDRASERLARWGAESDRMSSLQFLQLLRNLQRRFGPDSSDAKNPLARILVDFLPSDRRLRGSLIRAGLYAPSRERTTESHGGKDSIPWGQMDILTPPLIHSCRNAPGMSKRKIVCGYTGAFRFPSRALLPAADGRAFSLHRRRGAVRNFADRLLGLDARGGHQRTAHGRTGAQSRRDHRPLCRSNPETNQEAC